MKINWKKIENLYVKAAKKFLIAFAKEHPYEYFYGFSLDGDCVYWYMMVSLNTEPLLLKRAEHCKLEHADLYEDQTIERITKDYRWNSGDWGYFLVFDPAVEKYMSGKNPHFVKEYQQLMKKYQAYADSLSYEDRQKEKIGEQFNETMCRIVIRLEEENAFEPLNRSKIFRVLCADHDETERESERRLEKVRQKVKLEKNAAEPSGKAAKTLSNKSRK